MPLVFFYDCHKYQFFLLLLWVSYGSIVFLANFLKDTHVLLRRKQVDHI